MNNLEDLPSGPYWVDNLDDFQCYICLEEFTYKNRKHHCRACGKVTFLLMFLIVNM